MDQMIFGDKSPVFYVWAPRWIEASAGIRAFHYLCHALNRSGHSAYLVFTEPRHGGEPRVSSKLFTPQVTQEIADAHVMDEIPIIAIYPETLSGNPLGAKNIVRLLMNYSGALGGPYTFDSNEIIFAFSENIALDYEAKTGKKPDVFFIPPIDPREFSFQIEKEPYQVVYAGKYRAFVGSPPAVGSLPSIEIFRDGPKKQSRDEVKKLIANASVVYSFENSSIVTEAILSGTPAGFVPNEFLGEIIAASELSLNGAFIGESPEMLTRAKETVRKGADQYLKIVRDFPDVLKVFAEVSKGDAQLLEVGRKIRIPSVETVITLNRFRIAIQILKNQGFPQLCRELFTFAKGLLKK